MRIKFEPVRWLSLTVAALTALLGVTALTDALPVSVVGWLAIIDAALTAVLGVLTRGAVTSLARPRDKDGTPLVRQ